MTQAELWHLQLLAAGNTGEALQGLMTIIFAYLAAAYFVGQRLTRFQAILVSIFFSVGACGAAFMTIVEFRRADMFIRMLGEQFGVQGYSPNALMIPLFAILIALMIPASVLFMYQMRGRPPPV